ncbi:MAG: hypothetical protein WBL80_01905 [Erysipelotrichaceae bacterium]
MKTRHIQPTTDRKKVISIVALTITSSLIVVFGLVFGIVSILSDINYTVMGSTINGSVFAAVITFLGIRYFLSVQKLKKEVYKSSSQFSWENFTSDKKRTTEPLLTKYWTKG